jgi:pre-mRNA-splicing factor 38A
MERAGLPQIISVHGQNPEFLIEKIIRDRIRSCIYWKESCFGLNAATVIDRAIELDHIGGVYGGNQRPTPFICLLLSMLQLQPDMLIIQEFISNKDFKYLRALGLVYIRFVAPSLQVYQLLEPSLEDYRKLKERTMSGDLLITHMDEFVDRLLQDEKIFNIMMPRLVKRSILEKSHQLEPRKSPLSEEFSDNRLADTQSAYKEPKAPKSTLRFKTPKKTSDPL